MKMNEFVKQILYFICAALIMFIIMYMSYLIYHYFISKVSIETLLEFSMLLCFIFICFCASQLIQLHVHELQTRKREEYRKKHSSKKYKV